MTEDEAKTKWCPLHQIACQIGWKATGLNSKKCIASECMMWVEGPKDYNGHNSEEIKRGGHCGLVK